MENKLKTNRVFLYAGLALLLSGCSVGGESSSSEEKKYLAPQDAYMDTAFSTYLTTDSSGLSYYGRLNEGAYEAVVDRNRDSAIGTVFSSSSLTISSSITYDSITYSIVGIKESAFYDAGLSSEPSLPSSLTMIGSQAFGNCSFTSFTVPSLVTVLNPETFIRCAGLSTLSFGSQSSVTSIGDHCFDGDYSLNGIYFDYFTSLTTIGDAAFTYCASLDTVVLPSSLESIGAFAFDDCTGILSFFLPSDNLTSIGQYALRGVTNSSIQAMTSFSSTSSTWASFTSTWRNKTLSAQVPFTFETYHEGGQAGSGFFYTLSGGNATIIGYNGSLKTDTSRSVDLIIPDKFADLYPVVKINSQVFENHTELKTVTFNSTHLTEIGDKAFNGCYFSTIDMTNATSLVTIGEQAFNSSGNRVLTRLEIPASVVTIKKQAFLGYNNLRVILFTGASEGTAHLTTIGVDAFKTGNMGFSVSAANMSEAGDDETKNYATNDLVFPATLTTIGNAAFAWCHWFRSITFMDNTSTGASLSLDQYAFSRVYNVQTITLPTNISWLGPASFEHLTENGNQSRPTIHSVYLPSGITTISSGAFGGCNGISFYCEDSSKPSNWASDWNSYTAVGGGVNPSGQTMTSMPVYWNVTTDLTSTTKRKLITGDGSAGSMDFVQNADSDNAPIAGYTLSRFYYQATADTANYTATVPSTITVNGSNQAVTKIGDSAFYRCINTSTSGRGLTTVTFANPSAITSIGDYAFCQCTSLYKMGSSSVGNVVDLSGMTSLTSIGTAAFGWDTAITSMTLPHSITSIGGTGDSCAIVGCSALAALTVVDSSPVDRTGLWTENSSSTVTHNILYDGTKAVYCAPNFNVGALVLASTTTSVETKCFYYNTKVTSATLPSSLTTIGTQSFMGCTNMTSVTGGSGVTSIADQAFIYTSNLTSFPFTTMTSLGSIGNYAFNSSKLSSADLSSSPVTSLGSYAFYGCTNMSSCSFPSSGLSSVSYACFQGASALTDISWGGVTSLSDSSFQSTGLTSVSLPATMTGSVGKNAFTSCSKMTTLSTGNGVTSLGKTAFASDTKLASVTIGSAVSSIGTNCFKDDTALTSLSFDSSLVRQSSPSTSAVYFNSGAFLNCNFSSVVLPYGASFNTYVFNGNENLSALYMRATGAYYQANPGKYPQGWNFKTNGSEYTTYFYAETTADVDTRYSNRNYWHYVGGVVTPWASQSVIPS